jgi:hypothetical protein
MTNTEESVEANVGLVREAPQNSETTDARRRRTEIISRDRDDFTRK